MATVILAISKAEAGAGLAEPESSGTFRGIGTGTCRLTHEHVLTNLHSRPTLLALTLAWHAVPLEAQQPRAHEALNGAGVKQADFQTCGRLLFRGDGTGPVRASGSAAETWVPLCFVHCSLCVLA